MRGSSILNSKRHLFNDKTAAIIKGPVMLKSTIFKHTFKAVAAPAFLACFLAVPAVAQTEAPVPASETITPEMMKAPGNPHAITLTEMSGMAKLPSSDAHSIMLTDGSFEGTNRETQPTMVIISSDSEGGSAQDKDMDLELFAAVMMYLNEELFKSIKVKDTSLMTIADLPSAEVLSKAKGRMTGEKLMVVQWMLFSEDGKFVKILGYAPRKQFDEALPRFKAIRDGMIVEK